MDTDMDKEIVESARQSWNIITQAIDKEPKLYLNFEEFEKFYADVLKSLLEEEEEQ